MKIESLPPEIQHIGDGVSIGAVVGALLGWLPHIATLLTVVWLGIRIYETKTFQNIKDKIKRKFK